MKIGYVRPTHDDPHLIAQKESLSTIEGIHIIQEGHGSAKKRTSLDHMMESLKPGDQIYVYTLYNLADSTHHLNDLMNEVEEKRASIISLSESIDSSKKGGYSFSTILQHLVQFQRDAISEKTRSGLNEAQKKGAIVGRPKKPDANVQKAILMHESKKYSLAEIKEATGISKSTLYRNLEN